MDRRLFLKGISLWGAALNLERARLLAKTLGRQAPEAIPPGRNLLPPSVPPEVVAWFWMEEPEFQPEGYRQFIDLIAEHTNFGMLATSLRAPRHEITDLETHSKVKRAVDYAHQRVSICAEWPHRGAHRVSAPGRSHDLAGQPIRTPIRTRAGCVPFRP